jgi:hypothetical protein
MVAARSVTASMMLAAVMVVAIPACKGQTTPNKTAQKADLCDCATPSPRARTSDKPKPVAEARPGAQAHAPRRTARHRVHHRPRRPARAEGYRGERYDYRAAAPVRPAAWHDEWHGVWRGEWHGDWDGQWHGEWRGQWQGAWHPVPDAAYPPAGRYGDGPDGYAPGPSAYAPPPAPYGEDGGLTIDRGGWSGGVGYNDSGYGYAYGYGYGDGPAGMNGPTYNSYGQSFQYNPSRARPFRPRRMGMPAPPRFNHGPGAR